MSANKYFSGQFKDVRQEKLRRRRQYARRAEARTRFRQNNFE